MREVAAAEALQLVPEKGGRGMSLVRLGGEHGGHRG
jgi:hypothetical protein